MIVLNTFYKSFVILFLKVFNKRFDILFLKVFFDILFLHLLTFKTPI